MAIPITTEGFQMKLTKARLELQHDGQIATIVLAASKAENPR